MGKIFSAIEKYGDSDKNIIILAHGEEVPQQDGRIYLKMKTTGKMVRWKVCHYLSNCWNTLKADELQHN